MKYGWLLLQENEITVGMQMVKQAVCKTVTYKVNIMSSSLILPILALREGW